MQNYTAYKLDYGNLPELASQPGGADIDPAHIEALDSALHEAWDLGQNIILVWLPRQKGIDILAIRHYALSDFAARADHIEDDPFAILGDNDPRSRRSENVIEEVISGPKKVTEAEIQHLSRLLGYEIHHISLPFTPDVEVPSDAVEALIKRYSISYVEDRAVALFDIVGFSLLTPLDQVTQLNSLAYSVNAAHAMMLSKDIDISFARTTTGDGFYIWNRDRSVQANVNLYHFMHLVLADNAIARSKGSRNTTPLLRSGFHIGGHYEFYQSEGLSPTIYSYIVGDVTIELARMIDRALPGQVLLGDFWGSMPDQDDGHAIKIDTLGFIEKTQETLSSLQGLKLSGELIDSIKCYLTGDRVADAGFAVRKYTIADKHGKVRNVYNAKINIYRGGADPILLGLQTSDLAEFNIVDVDFVRVSETSQ